MHRSLLTVGLAVAGTIAGALSACRSRMDVTAGEGPIAGLDASVNDGSDASAHDDLDAGASATTGDADASDAAGACNRVVPRTEAGTCPVMPPGGVLCDRSDIAPQWC